MQFILVVVTIGAMIFSIRFTNKAIHNYGESKRVNLYRVKYLSKTITIAILFFYLLLLTNISGVQYSQVSIFLSSVFAILGVALFAQWSILSNITASLIIFFGFPYRVGDNIKIIDREDDISGKIEEIALFHVLIRRGDELITYPNNLILQKGVIKNPKPKVVEEKSDKAIEVTNPNENNEIQ